MPVILEEVDPSWIEDGWGIQGDQNEVRFDDDIPWDITAWTRDNQSEDSDHLCCAPPPTCPCITFTGVEFCCSSDDPPQGYFEDAITHPCDFLNDKPFCVRAITNDLCTYCTNDDACIGGLSSSGLNIWFGNCDTHEDSFSSNIFLNTVFIGGLWHIFAYVASSPFFGTFFYGTTTDLGIPAENQITSCMDDLTIDNEATNCIFGEPLPSIPIVAFGGTVSFGSCPPTGACCYAGGCLVTTECYCTETLSGTYMGDGTPCSPDPC